MGETMEQGQYYFERAEDTGLGPVAQKPPVCLYLEVTNRCNLFCQTCPRTFASVEKPADLSFERLQFLVDQIEDLPIAVLHGIGEPMINRHLPKMIRYLKWRGTRVLFNSNATLLNERLGRGLISAGLDEIRVSLDAADAETFVRVRGLPKFDLILRNLKSFSTLKKKLQVKHPEVSLWLVGLRETIDELPAFVRLAHELEIKEVYLQRLVYFDDKQGSQGVARPEQALYGAMGEKESALIREAEQLGKELGVTVTASGATTPEQSLLPRTKDKPWSLCRRPWTLMYITANGNVLPCCIAPFVERDYDRIILGNAFEKPLKEIFNSPRYQAFRRALLSDQPEHCCEGCGVRWSL
ncbi:MAG: SPASM domain-containing protein [Acidobacteria bacterium]|nr:SPASM domain-containing protein [Acidobacteriota bacterium]